MIIGQVYPDLQFLICSFYPESESKQIAHLIAEIEKSKDNPPAMGKE